jgi:hypothetical protein
MSSSKIMRPVTPGPSGSLGSSEDAHPTIASMHAIAPTLAT